MKRSVITGLAVILMCALVLPGCASSEEPSAEGAVTADEEVLREATTLDVTYGPGPIAFPLAKMAQDGLPDMNATIAPQAWTTADQLKAMVTSGQVDMAAGPLTSAIMLYNKGADVKLINVGVWGMLYVVTPDTSLAELSQLEGKEVAVAGKGGIHDLLFRHLLISNGIDPDEDLTITYMDLADIQTKIAMGELTYAVLNEPAASGAVLTAKKEGVALVREIDLQAEYAELVGDPEARIPWAVYFAVGDAIQDTAMIDAFVGEYANAAEWVNGNAAVAGPMVESMDAKMKAAAVADALQFARIDPVSPSEARAEIEAFYTELMKTADPEALGGGLPDDGFYYQP